MFELQKALPLQEFKYNLFIIYLDVEDNEKLFHKCGICNSIICNQAHSDCARINPRGNRKLTLLKDIQVQLLV